MMYCTRCGSDLKGSGKLCPACGYEISKMRQDLSSPRQVKRAEEPREWAPPIPDQRKEKEARRAPVWGPDGRRTERRQEEERATISFGKPGEEEERPNLDEDPRLVTGCSVCGGRPIARCFFTQAPLCNMHIVKMQIYVRTMPFGEKVTVSPHMASMKEGKVPTTSEAREAGMFFEIKPYHEWRRVA